MEEHVHVWPKFGQGCHCGAKQCLEMVHPEPTPQRMSRKPRRCNNAAVSPMHKYCSQHGGNERE